MRSNEQGARGFVVALRAAQPGQQAGAASDRFRVIGRLAQRQGLLQMSRRCRRLAAGEQQTADAEMGAARDRQRPSGAAYGLSNDLVVRGFRVGGLPLADQDIAQIGQRAASAA